MKKTLLILCPVVVLFSCSNKNDNLKEDTEPTITKNDSITNESNPYMENYDNKTRMKKLLDNAITSGDTLSYQEAYKDFLVSEHSQEFLYYSIKMAKRNNYNRAYFDIYCILNLLDKKNGYLSESDKNEALYYLLKAYEKGDSNAKSLLNDLYIKQNKKIPTSKSILISKW